MRWKKLPNPNDEEYSRELQKLGVKYPGSTQWYSYYNSDVGLIRSQSCVGLYTSIKPTAKKQYRHIQHYAMHTECREELEEVLCVRHPEDHSKNYCVGVVHAPGECPLCIYHDKDEYLYQINKMQRETGMRETGII